MFIYLTFSKFSEICLYSGEKDEIMIEYISKILNYMFSTNLTRSIRTNGNTLVVRYYL